MSQGNLPSSDCPALISFPTSHHRTLHLNSSRSSTPPNIPTPPHDMGEIQRDTNSELQGTPIGLSISGDGPSIAMQETMKRRYLLRAGGEECLAASDQPQSRRLSALPASHTWWSRRKMSCVESARALTSGRVVQQCTEMRKGERVT